MVMAAAALTSARVLRAIVAGRLDLVLEAPISKGARVVASYSHARSLGAGHSPYRGLS